MVLGSSFWPKLSRRFSVVRGKCAGARSTRLGLPHSAAYPAKGIHMHTKSKIMTGVGVLVAAGAVALGGVSMANAATGTASATQAPTTSVTASAAPIASAASPVSATPSTPSAGSSGAAFTYTGLTSADSAALWDADVKEASALTAAERSAKLESLLAQAKAQPSTGSSDVVAEKLSIAIKAYATAK
jgi:hypothetical protein